MSITLEDLKTAMMEWDAYKGKDPFGEKWIPLLGERIFELELKLEAVRGVLSMAVARLGGTVEGVPTARHNFLQRVDALRKTEADCDRIRAQKESATDEIARDRLAHNRASAELEAKLSLALQAVGLATTAVPELEMDPDDLVGMMRRVVDECEALRAKAEILDRPFPIQDGPSVPWSVMLPHESQCQKNHGQTLKRISERGGFGAAEAYLVVHGMSPFLKGKDRDWEDLKRKWSEFTSEVFGIRAERDAALAEARRLREGRTAQGGLCEEGADHMRRYLMLEGWTQEADERGDAPLADVLRAIMDPVWLRLTDQEHGALNSRKEE